MRVVIHTANLIERDWVLKVGVGAEKGRLEKRSLGLPPFASLITPLARFPDQCRVGQPTFSTHRRVPAAVSRTLTPVVLALHTPLRPVEGLS